MKFTIALLSSFAFVAAAHAADCSSPEGALNEAIQIAKKSDRFIGFEGDVTDYQIGNVGPRQSDGKTVQVVASTFDYFKAPDVTVQVVVLTELNADCSIASRTASEMRKISLK